MNKIVSAAAIILLLSYLEAARAADAITPAMSREQLKKVEARILSRLGKRPLMFSQYESESERKVTLERVSVSGQNQTIGLYFNNVLPQIAIREERIDLWEQMVLDTLGASYAGCKVKIYSQGIPIERYVPNSFRSTLPRDLKREVRPVVGEPLVKRLDQPVFGKGLSYRHIALWASHGRYYDKKEGDWNWQRPSLFGTREDIGTFEYMDHYLMPMLERAGAVLLSPRERDPQQAEIIVDNDDGSSMEFNASKWQKIAGGFAQQESLDGEANPFEKGSYLAASAPASLTYRAKVREKGRYALYISYSPSLENSNKVEYAVKHSAGVSRFVVNQRMGGGWVYLDTFDVDPKDEFEVVLSTSGQGRVTADAIRLGGGMGSVVRGGKVSGLPRWAEGARYAMQYDGVPSTIYAQDSREKKIEADYQDDYKSRGDWCNYIATQRRVPLDLAFGLHTNAGINDTIFGSLTIHYTDKGKGAYSDSKSKLAGRDLADITLTQLVEDIRTLYTPQWTRRSIYDKSYAEISRPDIPAMLVELLSHQNFNDVQLALDPTFRLHASRAIYKAIVRFVADRYGFAYQIAPLPPAKFAVERRNDKLRLSWREVEDPLESTARAESYKLYTRIGDAGFDKGVVVHANYVELPMPLDGVLRSYKVTALNQGGESLDSETLAAIFQPHSKAPLALVVNGFTRLSAPDTIRMEGGSGFDFKRDPGVPYLIDRGRSGIQTNFSRTSQFVDNKNPGWGASGEEFTASGVGGNSFDYPAMHAKALFAAGYSVVSCSMESLVSDSRTLSSYRLIDIIWGTQKRGKDYKLYTSELMDRIEHAHKSGVSVLMSGSYLVSEMRRESELSSRIAQFIGVNDGKLVVNKGSELMLSLDGKPLTNSPLSTVMPITKTCYPLPAIATMQLSAAAKPINSRYGTIGAYRGELHKGAVITLGVPLEVFSQQELEVIIKALINR